ncbi:MAG: hypothetical protein QM699_03065 [Amaricoccus sp.]
MDAMPEQEVPGFFLVLPKGHRRVRQIAAFCRRVEGERWQELEQVDA